MPFQVPIFNPRQVLRSARALVGLGQASGGEVLSGAAELDKFLFELSRVAESRSQFNKIVRKGTREGAKIVLAKAKRLVPVDEGDLEATMAVRSAVGTGKARLRRGEIGHMVVHVEKGGADPYYAHFVEFGTIKWEGDRYLRPALYDQRDAVTQAVTLEVLDGLEMLAAKANPGVRNMPEPVAVG